MQVNHVQDHISHAVIGRNETVEAGISDSAEFFTILSSTLYKDQILAVTRETLCNAWDAHIEAGCMDKPVELTLTDNKLIIKDFGKGIHHDDMKLVYLTYGNSTKKNDGKQTGGFGLGCKSPWAYTEHFEVISCHDGVKTIYTMSRSSAQAMGKPGYTKIASFPTTETGLQVSIGIKNSTDRSKFKALIERIVRNGDMNMKLNNELLPKLDFDVTKANYLITTAFQYATNNRIFLRYGNVVYPVDVCDEIAAKYDRVVRHLDLLKSSSVCYDIVFQAPPHSISVTPSREGLSMQEHTIKTLDRLFTGFLKTMTEEFPVVRDQRIVMLTEKAVSLKMVPELLSRTNAFPIKEDLIFTERICDLDTMAKRYLGLHYPNTSKFRKEDVTRRVQLMAKDGLLNRGLVQTFLRAIEEEEKTGNPSNWLQRRIIKPVVTKLMKEGLDPRRLFTLDGDDNMRRNRHGYRMDVAPLVDIDKASTKNICHALPYLRDIVVLSTSMMEIQRRARKIEKFNQLGGYDGYLFYHLSMKKAEREAAIKFFKASGMVVIDITGIPTSKAESRLCSPAVTTPRKPVVKGLVQLSYIKQANGGINTHLSRSDDATRIEDPEFIIQISTRQSEDTKRLDGWTERASRYIVELFGDKGGITTTSVNHGKYSAKGVKDMSMYLLEKVCAYIQTSAAIKEYWAYDMDRAIYASSLNRWEDHRLVKFAYNNPVLRQTFGLINNLTEEDEKYIYLYKQVLDRFSYTHQSELGALKKELDAIKLAPENAKFLDKMIRNPLVDMINESAFKRFLLTKPNPQQLQKLIDIVIAVVNN